MNSEDHKERVEIEKKKRDMNKNKRRKKEENKDNRKPHESETFLLKRGASSATPITLSR